MNAEPNPLLAGPRPGPVPAPPAAQAPAPAAAARIPSASAEPEVGDRVSRALEVLSTLVDRDVTEHPAVYESVHRDLAALLSGDR